MAVAGYKDTKEAIIDTLMGREVGHEIQPDEHQNFALKLLDYIRSVELISGSTLIGIAEADTVPVQPDDAHVAYIAGVAQDRRLEKCRLSLLSCFGTPSIGHMSSWIQISFRMLIRHISSTTY